MNFTVKKLEGNKKETCQAILDLLPDWFEIEETKAHYIKKSATLPMLGYYNNDGICIGFLSLEDSSPKTSEIFVMGVHPDFHRKGCGKALLQKAESLALNEGKEMLLVKTLARTNPDPHYAQTRMFYEKAGFEELITLPELWDKENPCLIMAKRIKP